MKDLLAIIWIVVICSCGVAFAGYQILYEKVWILIPIIAFIGLTTWAFIRINKL